MFRILIVEDVENTRLLFKMLLKQAGYEPVVAEDGEDALRKLDEV